MGYIEGNRQLAINGLWDDSIHDMTWHDCILDGYDEIRG